MKLVEVLTAVFRLTYWFLLGLTATWGMGTETGSLSPAEPEAYIVLSWACMGTLAYTEGDLFLYLI